MRVLREAPRYETRPVGGPPQGAFLNGAVCLATTLEPAALLGRLHAIEAAAGRARGAERNMPRSLDLDLLLYGDAVIEHPELVVPHPRLHERTFVLDPLSDIAPDVIHPVFGVSIRELAQQARADAAVTTREAFVDQGDRSWPS